MKARGPELGGGVAAAWGLGKRRGAARRALPVMNLRGRRTLGCENMHGAVARVACRAVGGPREQGVGRGERAATMCGMAAAAGMAMRGAEAWAACRMERGPREL